MSESPPQTAPANPPGAEPGPRSPIRLASILIRLGWGAVICAAVAGLFVVSFVLTMRAVFVGREVIVPDVAGMTPERASELLKESELYMESTTTRYDDRIAKDLILQQDPPAGAKLKRNRKVRVALSLGPLTARIPELRGVSLRGARAALERSGLKAGAISFAHQPGARADLVIAQEPWPDATEDTLPHGESAADGAVDMLVSRGQEPAVYVMPDLAERRLEEVERMARRFGLRLGGVRREPAGFLKRGVVVRHTPEAGFPVSQRDIITLVVGD